MPRIHGPSIGSLFLAACLLMAVAGCRALRAQGRAEMPAVDTQRIARLIADLGEAKGGLHAPYCMPFPRSKADDAWEALLKVGKPAVPQLIAGLKDKNTYRRAHCAGLLGEIGDRRGVEPLCAIVGTERNALGWVVDALAKLRDPRAVGPLMEILPHGSGVFKGPPAMVPNDGRMAAEALAEIGDEAVPRLTAALKSPDRDVRKNARYALDLIAAARKSKA